MPGTSPGMTAECVGGLRSQTVSERAGSGFPQRFTVPSRQSRKVEGGDAHAACGPGPATERGMGSTIEPGLRLDPAWTPALLQWFTLAWRWRLRLALCAALGAGVGMGVRLAFPGHYFASEQLLFDPQGMKV